MAGSLRPINPLGWMQFGHTCNHKLLVFRVEVRTEHVKLDSGLCMLFGQVDSGQSLVHTCPRQSWDSEFCHLTLVCGMEGERHSTYG